MPSPAWTYSDWDTAYTDGTAAQLARLKLHIKEVADQISAGSYTTEGKAHSLAEISDYLKRLEARRDQIAAAIGRGTFFRGVPLR